MNNKILTITELNYSVRHLLEMEFGQVWLVGEISNLSKPVSGHWYLTLKDSQSQVRCAMFRMKNIRVNFPVQNGMQVLVRASVSLYEPRGDYQVIIESMQPAGDGLLQQQFEQLKIKLAAEGLFSQEHKKTLPAFVKRVGVITSSSGAALHDILHILKRRDPSLEIVIYPTQVQGKEAAQSIAEMIDLANLRKECDVLIVGRGGGSLEDLWCFNEEVVAYAIHRSILPIISAVGHETDVTISDFVADIRAPTPSAAAELVSRDQREFFERLQQQRDRAGFAFDRIWAEKSMRFQQLQQRLSLHHPAHSLMKQQQKLTHLHLRSQHLIRQYLKQSTDKLIKFDKRLHTQHPQKQLEQQKLRLKRSEKQIKMQILLRLSQHQQRWKQYLWKIEQSGLTHRVSKYQHQTTQLEQHLYFVIQQHLAKQVQRFNAYCMQLDGLSPLKILSRGYSITQTQQGNALLNSQDVNIGDQLHTTLNKGEIISRVVAVKE